MPLPAAVSVEHGQNTVAKGIVPLAQSGALQDFALFHNGKMLTAEIHFSAVGVPTKAAYTTASRAARWAKAFAGSAETVVKLLDLRNTEPAAELSREIELLKLQLEKLEAEEALNKAKSVASGSVRLVARTSEGWGGRSCLSSGGKV